MRLKKTIAAKILVIFLIYVFMAGNTSGELVLCIGAHWHIALEPLTHEHNENHPHLEYDRSATKHEHVGYAESPHCKPCIDIPIFIGPTNNQPSLKPVKPNSNTFISQVGCALHTIPTNKRCAMHTLPACSFADENRFLRSVILLV